MIRNVRYDREIGDLKFSTIIHHGRRCLLQNHQTQRSTSGFVVVSVKCLILVAQR